jgi:hypothetical protein
VADYLLIIATFAFSYPPRAERHIQHMHMRFYRCRTRSAIQCLAIFLAPAFCLLETLVDRYPLRSKAGTSFFLSQPSIAAFTSRA